MPESPEQPEPSRNLHQDLQNLLEPLWEPHQNPYTERNLHQDLQNHLEPLWEPH